MPSWWPFSKNVQADSPSPVRVGSNVPLSVAAGLPNIMQDTEKLQKSSNYDNEFDMFDAMVKLDPELNGAVRSVALTANNYTINYVKAKNQRIRNAIIMLTEQIDLDDILINAMRNLMVWQRREQIGCRAGVGITDVKPTYQAVLLWMSEAQTVFPLLPTNKHTL